MDSRPYIDDPSILDGAILWRRVPNWPSFVIQDKSAGHYRVASSAFDDDADDADDDPMSIVLAGDATLESVLKDHEDFGVVAFTAGFARGLGQIVVRAPEEDQPAHAKVVGRKTHGVRRAFARAAHWVHRPPGYDELTLPNPAVGTD